MGAFLERLFDCCKGRLEEKYRAQTIFSETTREFGINEKSNEHPELKQDNK